MNKYFFEGAKVRLFSENVKFDWEKSNFAFIQLLALEFI